MTKEEIVDLIRVHRGKLAILYYATLPYNDETCYINITSSLLKFSTLSPIVAFEYHIPRSTQMDITRVDLKRKKPEQNLVSEVDDLNMRLSPFSKPSGPEPAKKASDTVFFEICESRCRFRQESLKFVGDWLTVREEKEDLWHPLPQIDTNEAIDGAYFRDALNRISSTGESRISLLADNKGVHLKSQAGRERVARTPQNLDECSVDFPRIQLQKACNLIRNFDDSWVSVSETHLVMFGKHENNATMKILIYPQQPGSKVEQEQREG